MNLTDQELYDLDTVKDLIDSHTQLSATARTFIESGLADEEDISDLLSEVDGRLDKAARAVMLYLRSPTKGHHAFIDEMLNDIHKKSKGL